jgi:replicative DNA helicase
MWGSSYAYGDNACVVLYHVEETSKINDLEPYNYLTTLLKELPFADTIENLAKLLPS